MRRTWRTGPAAPGILIGANIMKATAQQKAIDKYQLIEAFARRRYTKNGVLIVDVAGVPSIYSRIESAAWKKYRSSAMNDVTA